MRQFQKIYPLLSYHFYLIVEPNPTNKGFAAYFFKEAAKNQSNALDPQIYYRKTFRILLGNIHFDFVKTPKF